MSTLKWILTSLTAVLAGTAQAALSTLPAATAFYRSPDSAFMSGQTTRSNLERTRRRTELTFVQKIRWDGHEYAVKPDDLLRDLQCLGTAKLRENSALLNDMRSDALPVLQLAAGADVEILQTLQQWARVRAQNREGWVPLHRLDAKPDDTGVFVAMIDTFLRDKPSFNGKIHTTLPRRTRLTALGYDDGWIRVAHGGRIGYVDSLHLASRADFATWAWSGKEKKWHLLSHREGTRLKTKTGAWLELSDVTAYTANPSKSIVTQIDDPKLPPLRAHADLLKTEITRWGVSDLPGHGEVWWRQESQILDQAVTHAKGDVLTTDELLQRDVFSYAMGTGPKMEGLVSARGIWKTDDGLTWRRIESFGDRDWPVALRKDGAWLVGAHRSLDKGMTFEPYIRWDALARTIESKLQRVPKYIKLQKIEPMKDLRTQILVDTGIRRLTLITQD